MRARGKVDKGEGRQRGEKGGGEKKSSKVEQEAHGPDRSTEKTVQINKHTWLYHNVD